MGELQTELKGPERSASACLSFHRTIPWLKYQGEKKPLNGNINLKFNKPLVTEDLSAISEFITRCCSSAVYRPAFLRYATGAESAFCKCCGFHGFFVLFCFVFGLYSARKCSTELASFKWCTYWQIEPTETAAWKEVINTCQRKATPKLNFSNCPNSNIYLNSVFILCAVQGE